MEQELGCQTEGVLAGSGNLERIAAYAPDIAVLVFTYGPTENWELLDQLRVNEETSSIPIVAIAAREEAVVQSLASHNVRRVLLKPFTPDQLVGAIREILNKPWPPAPPAPERPQAKAQIEAAQVLATGTRQIALEWLCKLAGTEPTRVG